MRPIPSGLPPDVAQHAINFQHSVQQQQILQRPSGLPLEVVQHTTNFQPQPIWRFGVGLASIVVIVRLMVRIVLSLVCLAIVAWMIF